jgi:phosphoglycerate kinase
MAVPQAVTRVGRRLLSSKPALGAKVDLASLSRRVNLKGKTVLLRSDLNVPMTKQDPPTITDATRIEEAVPTIQLLIDAGAKVVLCSHVGRPKGAPNDQMRLAPMAAKLSELLGQPVESAADCIGEDVERRSAALKEGGVLMLENLRFHKQEEKNDPEFAEAIVKSSGCAA